MSDVERESETSHEALAAEMRELRAEVAGLRRGRRRSRVAIIGGAVAAIALVGGGVAIAVIPDSGTGVIHGCYSNSTGALRVIDPANQSCSGTESALNWNMRGITWRGAWNRTATYAANDAVAYNGSSYIAVAASTNQRPPAAASWATLSSGTLWAGTWSASKGYYPGAVVTYLGSSYLATRTSKADPPTDTTKWSMLASRGQPGNDGAAVLHGDGAPDDSLGVDGDFYIDTSADAIYGPKAGGNWPTSGTSLVGSPGAPGPGSTVISMKLTSGSDVDLRDIPNSDLSVDYSCEAGTEFAGTTSSDAYFDIHTADAPGLELSGVDTSTGNSSLGALRSTPTQRYVSQAIEKNGLAAFDADYDTNDGVAEIELATVPSQGDAGATYSQFTIVHGAAATNVTVYLQADNTGTPSCTVQATFTPTSQ